MERPRLNPILAAASARSAEPSEVSSTSASGRGAARTPPIARKMATGCQRDQGRQQHMLHEQLRARRRGLSLRLPDDLGAQLRRRRASYQLRFWQARLGLGHVDAQTARRVLTAPEGLVLPPSTARMAVYALNARSLTAFTVVPSTCAASS